MQSNKYSKIALVLASALILRFFLSPFGTLDLDQNSFIAWSDILQKGFSSFYLGWSDYLPGYLYVLWFLGKLKEVLPLPEVIVYKIPAMLADVGIGYLIYRIVNKVKDEKWALISSSAFLFNPAILANSTLWGQVDSLTAFFSLLSIYIFSTNVYLSALFLAIGTLIKPQAALGALVILFLMYKKKMALGELVTYALVGAAVFILGFVPFKFPEVNLAQFIWQRVGVTMGQYPYTSINAFSFWGIFGFWNKDTIVAQVVGYLLTITLFVIAAYQSEKIKDVRKYILAAIVFLSGFLFFTRMHERHLLPPLPFVAIAAGVYPLVWIPYLLLSLTYLANLVYSYVWITQDFKSIFSPGAVVFFVIVNFISLAILLRRGAVKIDIGSIKAWLAGISARTETQVHLPEIKIPDSVWKYLLLLVVAFAFISRIVWLTKPQNEYFDEVYHAFTARTMLHADPKAWEWWNTPPEGFAYEWTHPPLAKEGMWLGMKIFGEKSFGWRVPGAILGTLSVYLIYLIAKRIFDDEPLAVLSAFVFSLDGLGLVLSRIGMNDSYILFFALLSIYLFLRDKYFFSSLAWGLALSSKWSALWVVPIFAAAHFVFRKKFNFSYLWYMIIPPIVYLGSYIPMFFVGGHDLTTFIDVQKQMWWYHTRLRATHPYTSSWATWPFLVRPIWLYTSGEMQSWISNIYASGNPIVFWFGVASVATSAVWAFLEKNRRLGFVIFSYLVFFAPWAASPRIMFLYHYLPSVPFLAIATAYVLRRNPKIIIPFGILAGVVFLYFYPHWTGLSIPTWLDRSYYWFGSWR